MKKRSIKALLALTVCGMTVVTMCPSSVYAAEMSTNTTATVNASADTQNTETDSGDSNTPPEKPDGDNSSQGGQGDQGGQGGQGGQGDQGGQGGQGDQGGQGGQGGGSNTQTFDYTGTYSGLLVADGTTKTSDNESYNSTTKDQNVALAQNGGTLKIVGDTFNKSGDDSDGDTCNFYGLNSSVLAVGSGSKICISDSDISSTSVGSNGIFATDSATVFANNDTITTTTGGNSRGLDATYGGTIIANKMTISTEKDHCAALATDRGGGYISATSSSLKTAGSGSPLIYSTGDIEVDNITGIASGSQIAGMEGLNKILIYNSDLTSTNDAISGSDPIKNAVILYQSTSGDADTSTSEKSDFEAKNSTLETSITGGSTDAAFFYITNVSANVVLDSTQLDFDSDSVYLLYASGNSSNNWGTSGSNGGNVTFTAINESDDNALDGNIYVGDTYSEADVYLTQGSVYTGKTLGDGVSKANINVDADSTWIVTGDCSLGNLNAASGAKIVDANGNAVTIKTSADTVQEGTSDITVTVTGTYDTTVNPAATSVSSASVSRSDFDSYYETSTSFGDNGSSANTGTSTSASSSTKTSISGKSISLSKKTYTYSGSYKKPSVSIKGLIAGTDYKVTYSNNKNVGTATVTVTGIGNYKGTLKAKFKIIPKGTTIKSLKKASKAFTAKWKKRSAQTSGYQLRYSKYSSMKSAKKVTITKKTTVTKKIKKLQSKKKYYVQIRTYKTVKGKKYYSSWSKKKTVKTK